MTTVIFYTADAAAKDANLATGDEIECLLAVHPKTGEISARQIYVTKEAPKAAPKAQWVKKEAHERTNIIRYAKGPDGTRGFAMGRGRPIGDGPSAADTAI